MHFELGTTFGFFLDDKRLKRAGLDYWDLLVHRFFDSTQELEQAYADKNIYYVTTKGIGGTPMFSIIREIWWYLARRRQDCPKIYWPLIPSGVFRIPMLPDERARSLNLANSVAIVLYEALRQLGFSGLV